MLIEQQTLFQSLDNQLSLDNTIWEPYTGSINLSDMEIHVWACSLDQSPNCVSLLSKLLTIDELDRASRFNFTRHRNNFIVSRGVLRIILAEYLKICPIEVCLSYGKYGKPELDNKGTLNLFFNLSHSESLVMYAITLNQKIGIDLEAIREIQEIDQIVDQFFSIYEKAEIQKLPPGKQINAFYSIWTRKEAYIKALGKSITIAIDNQTRPTEKPNNNQMISGYRFVEIPINPLNYSATIVAEKSTENISYVFLG